MPPRLPRPKLSTMLILLSATTADAQTVRFGTSYQPLIDTPASIVSIDVNDDARSDLIATYSSPLRYRVMLATEDGRFVEQSLNTLSAGSALKSEVADVNVDGRDDLVLLSQSDGLVFVLLNNGDGTLSNAPGSPLPATNNPQAVTVADMNQDGLPEILVGDQSIVVIYFNSGNATFGLPQAVPTLATSLTDIAAADLRGNGDNVIVLLTGNTVRVLHPSGGGYTQVREFNLSFAGFGLEPADTNNDGITDLIVPIDDRYATMVIRHTQDTTYTFFSPTNPPSMAMTSYAVGDLNNDGLLDVAFGQSGQGFGRILYGVVSVTGLPQEIEPLFGEFSDLRTALIADTDGDGKNELVYIGTAPNGIMTVKSDELNTFRGTGRLTSLTVSPTALVPVNLPDELPAFFIPHTSTTLPLEIATVVPDAFGYFGVQSTQIPGTTGATTSWAVGDVNGDGVRDLINLARVNSTWRIRWQLGIPGGGFSTLLNRSVSSATASNMVIADFNEDGLTDAAVLDSTGEAKIVFGDSSGIMTEPVIVPMTGASGPGSLAAADIDADGDIDLVCTNRQSGSSAVYIAYGLGKGSFEPAVSLSTLSSAGSTSDGFIHIADANRDGILDIAVATSSVSCIHLSLGSRSYQPFFTISSGSNLSDVRIVDFDGDGFAEVATTFRGYTEVASRSNQGAYAGRSGFYHSTSIDDIVYADYNADTLPDIIYADATSLVMISNNSVSGCPADYYLDGRLDLFDVAQFLNDFNSSGPFADFNRDGAINFFDLSAFLAAYGAGCP